MSEIIIPASHDWHVLRYAGGRAERVPIVAWRITGEVDKYLMSEPVTVNPALDILCPDGTVTGSFGQFKNQDMWLESMRLAQDPAGWSDEPPPAAPVAPVYASASDASVTVSDGAAPPAAPTATSTRVTVDGGAILKSRPPVESKAAGLRRRRAIRRSRARAG